MDSGWAGMAAAKCSQVALWSLAATAAHRGEPDHSVDLFEVGRLYLSGELEKLFREVQELTSELSAFIVPLRVKQAEVGRVASFSLPVALTPEIELDQTLDEELVVQVTWWDGGRQFELSRVNVDPDRDEETVKPWWVKVTFPDWEYLEDAFQDPPSREDKEQMAEYWDAWCRGV